MITDFQLIFIDKDNFNSLLLQIEYKEQILCILNKESGNGNIEIEFFNDHYKDVIFDGFKFPIDEFIEVLIHAKNELSLCP